MTDDYVGIMETRLIKGVLTLILLIFGMSVQAEDSERLFWDKVPLGITLPVGQERLVTFPSESEVRVGVPSSLAGKLRTQSHNGTVYWLAEEPFDAQRIEVRETGGGAIYLIDLGASNENGIPANPIEVLNVNKQTRIDERSQTSRKQRNPRKAPGLVALTRFAAQQLYAPARMLKASPDIHRVVITRRPLSHLISGETIEAIPIAGWQGAGRLYVTAIKLRNTGQVPLTLDPRRIRGSWRAATFQHVRLHPAGSEADTTAVYLVSDRPFHEMIREVI